MPSTAIWFGRLLVLVGAIGYGYGMSQGAASVTALIPAFFGIVIMACGHLGMAETRRKLMMHIAVTVGLLGVIAAVVAIFRKGMPESIGVGTGSQIAMAVVCLVFVVLCVRSFIAARGSRDV